MTALRSASPALRLLRRSATAAFGTTPISARSASAVASAVRSSAGALDCEVFTISVPFYQQYPQCLRRYVGIVSIPRSPLHDEETLQCRNIYSFITVARSLRIQPK